MRAASSRPRAGIAAAAPKPHARPTPATVRRTPRRASSAERARFVARRRHQLRNPAAAATAPTHPSVSPTGWEFQDRKSTRLNSSHGYISYAVFCLKKKKKDKSNNKLSDGHRARNKTQDQTTIGEETQDEP